MKNDSSNKNRNSAFGSSLIGNMLDTWNRAIKI